MLNLNNSFYKYILLILVIMCCFFLSSCTSKNEFVAKIGDEIITLEEYRISYLKVLKQPNIFDSKKLREEFLDDMIEFKILANEAKKNNCNSDDKLKYKIEAYKNKSLRELHYEKVIKPKIKIDEKDIEDAYIFTQEKRRISHLFLSTKKSADSIHSLLENGSNFELLASQIFKDDSLKNSGGDLGWITWDQFDYDLATAAFTMPFGKYSEPIKSSFGFHIIKATDYKKKPLITRNEYELHKKRAKSLLEYKIGDKIASEYINNLVKSADVVMYPEVYYLVKANLSINLKRIPTQFDHMSEFQLQENEVKQIESNLWDSRDKIIATVNGADISVGEFLGGLHYVPYKDLYNSFNSTFKILIRDYLLTAEAKSFGYENETVTKNKVKLFEEYLIQLNYRRSLINNTRVEDLEIEQYYDNNIEKYKNASKRVVQPIIKDLLLNKKRRDAVSKLIAELSKEIEICKNTDLIHNFYETVINDVPKGSGS